MENKSINKSQENNGSILYSRQKSNKKAHGKQILQESEESCLGKMRKGFDSLTDKAANFLQCTRLFSNDRLDQLKQVVGNRQDPINQNDTTKSVNSQESSNLSKLSTKQDTKSYKKLRQKKSRYYQSQIPVKNYSIEHIVKFNKRYVEDYSQSYSERQKRFKLSFQQLEMKKLRQYELKSKNFWSELKRWLFCRGGNFIQQDEQIYTQQNQISEKMFKMQSGRKQPQLFQNQNGNNSFVNIKQPILEQPINEQIKLNKRSKKVNKNTIKVMNQQGEKIDEIQKNKGKQKNEGQNRAKNTRIGYQQKKQQQYNYQQKEETLGSNKQDQNQKNNGIIMFDQEQDIAAVEQINNQDSLKFKQNTKKNRKKDQNKNSKNKKITSQSIFDNFNENDFEPQKNKNEVYGDSINNNNYENNGQMKESSSKLLQNEHNYYNNYQQNTYNQNGNVDENVNRNTNANVKINGYGYGQTQGQGYGNSNGNGIQNNSIINEKQGNNNWNNQNTENRNNVNDNQIMDNWNNRDTATNYNTNQGNYEYNNSANQQLTLTNQQNNYDNIDTINHGQNINMNQAHNWNTPANGNEYPQNQYQYQYGNEEQARYKKIEHRANNRYGTVQITRPNPYEQHQNLQLDTVQFNQSNHNHASGSYHDNHGAGQQVPLVQARKKKAKKGFTQSLQTNNNNLQQLSLTDQNNMGASMGNHLSQGVNQEQDQIDTGMTRSHVLGAQQKKKRRKRAHLVIKEGNDEDAVDLQDI